MTGDVYYWVVSLHGLAMLLLFAVQAVTGLANVAVSKLIGALDLYWPNKRPLLLAIGICFSFDVVGASLRPSRRWAWLDYISAVFNAVLAVAGRRPYTYWRLS
jgi:heme/copper-type cytochrome/quinol oxidase subunit 1